MKKYEKNDLPIIYHWNPNRSTTEIQRFLKDSISSGMTSNWED